MFSQVVKAQPQVVAAMRVASKPAKPLDVVGPSLFVFGAATASPHARGDVPCRAGMATPRLTLSPRPWGCSDLSLLEHVVAKCDGSAPMAYKRAGISRQVYSRIISTMFAKVDKLTVMRLCIGLQLTENESNEFLKAAGYAFSDTMPVDLVFSYCIRHGVFNIFDVNRLLEETGQKPFDIVF